MSPLRKLAGQTAIYGVSSILGRVMTFLLTPLYTRVFLREEYGVVTELYAWVAFAIVILTYGMETTFFRFGSKATSETERDTVFSTAFISILTTTALFVGLIWMNLEGVSDALHYSGHPEYILYFTLIVALDVLCAIPLARLRMLDKAIPFAAINLISIFTYIGLNLFFLLYCPYAIEENGFGHGFIASIYNPSFGIGYIFISNLVASALKFVLLLPWIGGIKNGWSFALFKKLMPYTLPLLLLGVGGIINETFDRAFFTELSGLSEEAARVELAIYGACYKVAMLLSIAIQAYRFAAEPFVFSLFGQDNEKKTQADIMKYYVIVGSLISLALMCFLDVALLLVGPEFRTGKGVIPILLAAYLCFGAVFNLSFWYKLGDKTKYGAVIAFVGAGITVLLNVILVPRIGYFGSAWATLAAYVAMLVTSFALSRKHHPIPYDFKAIFKYVGLALGLVIIHQFLQDNMWVKYLSGILFVGIYAAYIWTSEKTISKAQ